MDYLQSIVRWGQFLHTVGSFLSGVAGVPREFPAIQGSAATETRRDSSIKWRLYLNLPRRVVQLNNRGIARLWSTRSAERRAGKECVRPGRSRWETYHSNTEKDKYPHRSTDRRRYKTKANVEHA